MVKIDWTEDAVKDLEKLDKPVEERVLKKLTGCPTISKELLLNLYQVNSKARSS